MYKLYNTQDEISTKISNLIKDFYPNISKTHLNILPSVIFGMMDSESVVTSDICKSLKGTFSFNHFESNKKRIYRFLNNPNFDGYLFYHNAIKFVVSKFVPKHSDNRIHISFDHTYINNRFVIFMLTMRVGKQGIPIWFRCFPHTSPGLSDSYQTDLFIEGINYVSNLFNSFNADLIFLADRWFGTNPKLLEHIDSLGHHYVLRTKGHTKVFYKPTYEKHKIWSTISNLPCNKYHSKSFENLELFNCRYKANIVITPSENHKERWYLITNLPTRRADKDYGYRFGSIECMFKNQKSNGFYLEATMTRNIHAFENLYSITCFAVLFLTIYGTYYEKNKYKVFRNFNLKTSYQKSDKSRARYMSLFNTGLTLFKLAINSNIYISIPYTLKLYDI